MRHCTEDHCRPERASPPCLLVLGGCRSGKSRFAEEWLAARYHRRLLIATLTVGDDQELAARVELHRARRDQGWQTLEEPLALTAALGKHQDRTEAVLVDCLTLWLTNLLLAGVDDVGVRRQVEELAGVVRRYPVPLALVANEVGLGLVPDNPLARRFRDLAGWCNQRLAAACDQVVLVTAGLPLVLKGEL